MQFGGTFVRGWSAVATALGTAALVDGAIELLSNEGWLGTALRDDHQESVLPVAIAAALVLLVLALGIALRARRGEAVRFAAASRGERALFVTATLLATFVAIVAMEAWETRFGGLAAFDPRSVFLAHLPWVAVAYVVASALVSCVVRAALRAASTAGTLASRSILRRSADRRAIAPATHVLRALDARRARLCRDFELGARAMRAPPALQADSQLSYL